MIVTDLLCEGMANPLGLVQKVPEFSWRVEGCSRQSAWQIRAAASPEALETGDLAWNSGKVPGSRNRHIVYGGEPLRSRERLYWQVRSWDENDRASEWSETAWCEAGLYEEGDWEACWSDFPCAWNGHARLFQYRFQVPAERSRARLYISGIGLFSARVNGVRLGDAVLDPAPTDYSRRVLYRVFDLGPMLRDGENVLAIHAGNGWRGSSQIIYQVEIDGITVSRSRPFGQLVSPSPIYKHSLYGGTEYDAREEQNDGWEMPGGPMLRSKRSSCRVPAPGGRMVAQVMEPIRRIMELEVAEYTQPIPGVWVADFGQNIAGWCRLAVSAPAGTRISLTFAEYLDAKGRADQDNLLGDKAVDVYICKGEGVEVWEPEFTYHGFRYVEIAGLPQAPAGGSVTGIVVNSDCRPAGTFRTSSELVNHIQHMIHWTEQGNLHGIPTDCPQRTERMGWLNDMMARCECALFNFDEANLMRKWLYDIADAQDPKTGFVPMTAPNHWTPDLVDPVCSSFVEAAWYLHVYYGETALLRRLFPNFRAWIGCMRADAPHGIIENGGEIGDWVPPVEFCAPGTCRSGIVPRELVATALYYYAVTLTLRIGRLIGDGKAVSELERLAGEIRTAFNRRFGDGQGGYESDSQSAYSYALYACLVPEELRQAAFARLVARFEADGRKLTTGNVGTKYLFETLSAFGRDDLAFAMVDSTEYPGWGFMAVNGATTLWERWELATGDGMNSHNHPMLGSVGSWFFKYLAGIRPAGDAVGFDRIILDPRCVDGLDEVEAEYRSVQGPVRSHWKRTASGIEWQVDIPANAVGLFRGREYPAGRHTIRL